MTERSYLLRICLLLAMVSILGFEFNATAATEAEIKSLLTAHKWCSKDQVATSVHQFKADGLYSQTLRNSDGRSTTAVLNEKWYIKGEFVSIQIEKHLVEWLVTIVQKAGQPKVVVIRPTRIINPDGSIESLKGSSSKKEVRLESCL